MSFLLKSMNHDISDVGQPHTFRKLKKKKQQRKRNTERKWRANEETGGSYTRTK